MVNRAAGRGRGRNPGGGVGSPSIENEARQAAENTTISAMSHRQGVCGRVGHRDGHGLGGSGWARLDDEVGASQEWTD